MSYHNRLEDSLRFRNVHRIEAGRFQARARRLQVAPKVVSRFWNQFQTSGTIIRRPVQSHPRATTPANDGYLTLSAWEHRQTIDTVFTRDQAAPSRTRISRQTVYRRLAEVLYAQNPVVCLLLSTFHKTARLSWSRTHHSWTYQDWRRILFTHEFSFKSQSYSRRVWSEFGASCPIILPA